jgi:hypothetical protein
MTGLTRADPDTITDAERVLMDDALQQFRFVRPGDRGIVEYPFRDATGRLVTVHYVWADRPGFVVGRALIQPNGHFAVEV